ncbi:MAG: META domain-containing protein [Dongiaceae bacterium]
MPTPAEEDRPWPTAADRSSGRLRAALPAVLVLALAALSPPPAPAADLPPVLAGELTFLADAARFSDCATGRAYPVAMEGDFASLETGYRRAASAPGAPLYVTFEGAVAERPRADGGGTEPTILVGRFVAAWPQERCERARAPAALENTYWRIVRLGAIEPGAAGGRREPHLILGAGGKPGRFSATVGCNQMAGGYRIAGDAVAFTGAASTRMACPPPLDEAERYLAEALAAAARWRIVGNTLELLDTAGNGVALLEAVYF